jgi:hypothetical protein
MDNENRTKTDNVEAFLFELHELMDRYDVQIFSEILHVIIGGTRFRVSNRYDLDNKKMDLRRFKVL